MIALGSAALTEGFALAGFEIWSDVTCDDVERVVGEVLEQAQKALILVESDLVQEAGPALRRARCEAAHVVVTEVPPLRAPEQYRPEVEDLVVKVLGQQALEGQES